MRPPEFVSPVDVAARVAATPADASVRGLFLQRVLTLAEKRGAPVPGHGRYLAFKNYPLRTFVAVIPAAARRVHPDLPVREAMRRLGQACTQAFLESLPGRVTLGVLGPDPQAWLRAASRTYEATQSHGRVELVSMSDRHCVARYTQLYQYLDCFEVGVIEAALMACGVQAEVMLQLDSPESGLVAIRW